MAIYGLRLVRGPLGREVYKGGVLIGRLSRDGREYRGVTVGGTVAGTAEWEDEALDQLLAAWEEDHAALEAADSALSDRERAAAEARLQLWRSAAARTERERDPAVLAAVAAGVSKNRVHVLTGIARTTIDRIVREHVDPDPGEQR